MLVDTTAMTLDEVVDHICRIGAGKMVRAFNGKTNWQIAEEDRAKTTAWSRARSMCRISLPTYELQRVVESLPDARRFPSTFPISSKRSTAT